MPKKFRKNRTTRSSKTSLKARNEDRHYMPMAYEYPEPRLMATTASTVDVGGTTIVYLSLGLPSIKSVENLLHLADLIEEGLL